MGTLLMGTLQN